MHLLNGYLWFNQKDLLAANIPFADSNKLSMKCLLDILPVQIIYSFVFQAYINSLCDLLPDKLFEEHQDQIDAMQLVSINEKEKKKISSEGYLGANKLGL